MEQTTMETSTNNAPARPTFLTVLCILTWVGSGLMGLLWLIMAVASGALSSMADKIPALGALMGAGAIMFVLMCLLCVGNIIGAVQMWKGKLMGLYIYTATETLYFIVSAIFSMKATSATAEAVNTSGIDLPEASRQSMEMAQKSGGFPFLGLILTIAFIVMYWLNKKALR